MRSFSKYGFADVESGEKSEVWVCKRGEQPPSDQACPEFVFRDGGREINDVLNGGKT